MPRKPDYDLKLRACAIAKAAADAGQPMNAEQIREAMGGMSIEQWRGVRSFIESRGVKIERRIAHPVTNEDLQLILAMVAQGKSNRTIGEATERSAKTVENILNAARARGIEVPHRRGPRAGKPRHMTMAAYADRAIEAQQRAERLAAGQGDDVDAPPPWRKIIPCPRVVASLRQHYRSHEAAYEAAQRDVFRRRHGVSIAR